MIGTASSLDPTIARIARILGDVEILDEVASTKGASMPRPTTQSKPADTVGFWLPTEINQTIEGKLSDASKEDGFRGNVYHLIDDAGKKTRLPVHAELQRKLDGIHLDIVAGTADRWIVITYTGKEDDETRHYTVEFFPIDTK